MTPALLAKTKIRPRPCLFAVRFLSWKKCPPGCFALSQFRYINAVLPGKLERGLCFGGFVVSVEQVLTCLHTARSGGIQTTRPYTKHVQASVGLRVPTTQSTPVRRGLCWMFVSPTYPPKDFIRTRMSRLGRPQTARFSALPLLSERGSPNSLWHSEELQRPHR